MMWEGSEDHDDCNEWENMEDRGDSEEVTMVEKIRKPSVIGISMQLDSILEELGNFGRYQSVNYLLIVVPIVFNAFFTTSYIFTAADTTYRCKIPECDGAVTELEPIWLTNAIPQTDNIYDRCERFQPSNQSEFSGNLPKHAILNDTCPSEMFIKNSTVACSSWVYGDHMSIVSEFDIGCHSWKRTLIGTMNNVGQFFCLPLTGLVSDRYGRRTILVGGAVLSGIVGLTKSFAPEYWSFTFLEFLEPLLGSGVYSAAFILGIELVGPKYRVLGGAIISSFYAIGEMLMGLVAWLFPYWRTLLKIVYTPSILLVCYFWIIPESVRWLLTKGKTISAGRILTKAANVNGKVLSEKTLQKLYSSAEYEANEESKKIESSASKVLKSRILVVRLVCCSFWWITCTFVYYGLSLNSVSIAGNVYLNFVLVSLIEIPGYIMVYLCLDRFGRRATLCASFIGSGLACVSFAFVPVDMSWLKLTLYLFGKFNITISFTAVYVYTTELFPTSLRHSLLAVCSMFGRVGSIVAPQTPLLKVYLESFPLILFGATSAISGIMVLFFPETNNLQLPDTIEEAESISRKKVQPQTKVNV